MRGNAAGNHAEAPQLGFGMFLMPVHDPRKPLAQCYDEDLELAQRCEQLGFADFWVGEHHSSTYENIVMPEIFIAKAFGMTESIRFGPAPVCLQYHHPAQVAGRAATLSAGASSTFWSSPGAARASTCGSAARP